MKTFDDLLNAATPPALEEGTDHELRCAHCGERYAMQLSHAHAGRDHDGDTYIAVQCRCECCNRATDVVTRFHEGTITVAATPSP